MKTFHKTRFLLPAVLVCVALPASLANAQTGRTVPELKDFDTLMSQTMAKWHLPGGSLAIMRHDRLVFARGYGYMDRDAKLPAQPDSLYRIGSNSKSITAAAVLNLVQEGKLDLDRTIVDLLGSDLVPPDTIQDGRWKRITVRHLLQHSGGWDADTTFDPMVLTGDVLEAIGVSVPVRVSADVVNRKLIRFMAGQPLQFDPGTSYAYSSFGYCLLGRVVERVSGMAYRDYVQAKVFKSMDIRRAAMATMPPTGRRLGEVEYYGYPDEPEMPSVYHADGRLVPPQDGGAFGEALDSTGGWVVSSIDLARFSMALDGTYGKAFLSPSILTQMKAMPAYTQYPQQYYGLGWMMMRPSEGEFDWFHVGALSGTTSLVFRGDSNGLAFAVSFNSNPGDDQVNDLAVELYLGLKSAAASVKTWPTDDQWSRYNSRNRPRLADAGIANAASSLGGGVSGGELISLFGEQLGPAAGASASLDTDGRFPTQLGSVRVLFDGKAAPLLYVSSTQINAVVPFGIAGRPTVRVQVETGDGKSDEQSFTVSDYSPGLFTGSGNGRGAAAALNSDLSVNSADHAASKGDAICLFVTGTGVPSPAPADGSIADTASDYRLPIKVTIGGQDAQVLYAGAAPGLAAGVVQVNAVVPSSAPAGEAAVQIELGGVSSRGSTTVEIR